MTPVYFDLLEIALTFSTYHWSGCITLQTFYIQSHMNTLSISSPLQGSSPRNTRGKIPLCNFNYVKPIVFLFFLALQVGTVRTCYNITAQDSSEYCTICVYSSSMSCSHTTHSSSVFLNSSSCSNQCCSSSKYKNTQSYQFCNPQATISSQADNSSTNLSLATILIVVFFSIPAGICLFIAIATCVNNIRRRRELQNSQPPPLSSIDLQAYNLDDLGPFYQDRSQSCSICLETDCNLRTKCGHLYHTQCLSAWVHKTQKCPLCITRQFNPILLYCTSCFIQTKIVLLIDQMDQQQKEEWEKYTDFKCDSCIKSIQDDLLSVEIELPLDTVEKFNEGQEKVKVSQEKIQQKIQLERAESVTHINRSI